MHWINQLTRRLKRKMQIFREEKWIKTASKYPRDHCFMKVSFDPYFKIKKVTINVAANEATKKVLASEARDVGRNLDFFEYGVHGFSILVEDVYCCETMAKKKAIGKVLRYIVNESGWDETYGGHIIDGGVLDGTKQQGYES